MKFVVALALVCISASSYLSPLFAQQDSDLSVVVLSVTDQAGTRVPNAEVQLSPMPQEIENIFTGTDGKLQLTIPARDYELTVMEPGFVTAHETVKLESGAHSNVDIALKIGGSCPGTPGCPTFIASPPQFYAATIKAATIKRAGRRSPREASANVFPGGRVVIQGETLKDLIAFAYNVHPWQISSSEDWTGKTALDIEAKLPQTMQLVPMMWDFLADRFQLRYHIETKTDTVYLLRRNPKTLQLQLWNEPHSAQQRISRVDGRWVFVDTTMPQLAEFASDFIVHGRVIDITCLSGAFDFRSSVSEMQPTDNTSSFLSALSGIGVNLKSSKGPVEYFVIDRAAKPSLK